MLLTKRTENLEKMLPADLPANIWLGGTVGCRSSLYRIDDLRKTKASVKFLSVEPLLEDLGRLDLSGIDLAIFGGESGAGARNCDLDHHRNGVKECQRQNVLPYVKQLSAAWATANKCAIDDFKKFPADLQIRQMPEVR